MAKKRKIGKRACIRLARQLARTTGVCARCGRTKDEVQIQAAHILPEERHWTACHLDNMIELCASCHKWGGHSWHKDTLGSAWWFHKRFPKLYDELLKYELDMRKLYGDVPDWEEVHTELKAEQKRRKNGNDK